MWPFFTDVLDFVEGPFGGAKSAPTSITTVAAAAETAIATAQATMALTETIVSINAQTAGQINKGLAQAASYAQIVANTPTASNLQQLVTACNGVVAATPPGPIHNKLSAVFAAVTLAYALYQQQAASAPLPLGAPTPGTPEAVAAATAPSAPAAS